MAEIRLAETAGFCFGVDRAVKMCEKYLDEGRRVCTLGPIIHNDRVVSELAARGCTAVESPEEVPEGAEAFGHARKDLDWIDASRK